VQIIGGFAILIWYVLALGQIFGDEYDRGYVQIGLDAFAHWEIGGLLVSFSWPEIPGFGNISFALSFSGVVLQYAVTMALPFFTRGFGIKHIMNSVSSAAPLAANKVYNYPYIFIHLRLSVLKYLFLFLFFSLLSPFHFCPGRGLEQIYRKSRCGFKLLRIA